MNRDACQEIKLHAAHGASLIYTKGATARETGAAWTTALAIADSIEDAEYQLRSLWGLWVFNTVGARHQVARALAQRFSSLAEQRHDRNDRLIGEQMIGVTQYYLGDQTSARHRFERVLAGYVPPDLRSHFIRFQLDPGVLAGIYHAWVLWLQGFPDRAMRAAESSIDAARASNHALTLCYALSHAACSIALLLGDLVAADHYLGMLLDHSEKHGLARWHGFHLCYRGVLVSKRGDIVNGLRLLHGGWDNEPLPRFVVLRFIAFLVAEAFGRAGRVEEGLGVINGLVEVSEERWCTAELLRVKGELLLLKEAFASAATAEDHFRRALSLAGRQGALSWELRAATSLGRLLCNRSRSAEALELLNRFTTGSPKGSRRPT